MGEQRETTVDDLNSFDIGHRVTFRRPASMAGRPVIVANLLEVGRMPYSRGNIPRIGYSLTVQYASRPNYTPNRDQFGPLPGNFPIAVGPKWRIKELETDWSEFEEDLSEYSDVSPTLPPR